MEFRLADYWKDLDSLKYGGKTQNIGGLKKKGKRIFTKNIRSGLPKDYHF